MNFLRRTLAPLAAALLAATFVAPPVQAQLDVTPQSLNAQATNEMKAGNWGEALQLLTTAVERFDRNAMMLFGPQFGVTWYRKGICELRLKRFEDAMKSFETCYVKYPNDAEQAASGGNAFNKRALLRWAEAAMGAEQWETALKMYAKFMEERDASRDTFDPGALYINLAIANFKLGNMEEGTKHFETALKNKARFQVSDSAVVAAFQALVGAVIEAQDEQSLLSFVDANRAAILIEPYEMQPYTPLLLSLAGKVYNAGMERSAFMLYQMIPATRVMLDDVEAQLARLGESMGFSDGSRTIRRDSLTATRQKLEAALSSGDPHEVIQLRATAFLHETHGNIRGAYAAYLQLERFYPESERREDSLYNLIRTSSLLGKTADTETYGSLFLKEFPDSEHVPAVRRLLLTSLFYAGKYETVIETASEMLPRLESGTEEHDIALHVLGGSYYYTGRYGDAQPRLDQHVTEYPDSSFALAASYFQASNEARRQFWAKSARLLDEFMEEYPDPNENVFLPFALYDRANAHYSLDENDAALEKLNRIESEFPNSEVIALAVNLKGNVLQSENKSAEAEEAYVKALEIAERRGEEFVAAEALNYLVGLLGQKPGKDGESRLSDAVAYADRFWENYSDSPYKAQVAVSQMDALQAADRSEEALNRLRDVISEMANTPGAAGLEEAIGSYTEAYLAEHTPEELKEHYYNFPGIRSDNMAARALLRVAVIGVFEDQLKAAAPGSEQQIQAEAGIQVLFTDLKNEFDLDDLSNFILVRVGDFIRATNSPREALPYYSEVLSRDDKSHRFPALFGRAAILAQGSSGEQEQAVEDFKRVLADAEDRSDKDRALFEMIKTQLAMGDYEAATENAKRYLDREEGFSEKKPEVALMLAESYEARDMTEDALVSYLNAWNSYKGAIRISAPAIARYMEILWERNQQTGEVSDRQGAYNAGRDYIDQTRRIIDNEDGGEGPTDEEIAAWREVEQLVERYVADPAVKSKEQLAEEAASR